MAFAWIGMGSEGRQEQTVRTDQDNGIVFQNVPAEEFDSVQIWFLEFAEKVSRSLEICGFPLCEGNIMASNRDLCQNVDGWKSLLSNIIFNPSQQDLTKATMYFDFRFIHGRRKLVDEVRDYLFDSLEDHVIFFRNISGSMLSEVRPPIRSFSWRMYGLTGIEPRKLDLKMEALIPLVAAVRVLALANGVRSTHTLERLQQCMEKGKMSKSLYDAVYKATTSWCG